MELSAPDVTVYIARCGDGWRTLNPFKNARSNSNNALPPIRGELKLKLKEKEEGKETPH